MNAEYETISSNALKSLDERKFNAPTYLPLASNVKKLSEYINKCKESAFKKLMENKSCSQTFKRLSELTLASILLFNRRRAGEIQRMTIENFQRGMMADPQCNGIADSLGTIEKMLMDTLRRVEIRGKRGRRVPVLLRPTHVNHIKTLIDLRGEVGIPQENRFVFPRLYETAETPLEATKIMRTLSSEAELTSPELMMSTLVRKHIATTSQLVELAPSELQQLANFMGHDLNVHMNYYRLPDDIEQITKVGRILVAAEEGKFKRSNHDVNMEQI